MAPQLSILWRSLKTQQIYGANTNVGKTIMSTILCKALANTYPTKQTWYLKPVSTGEEDQGDDGHVSKFSPKTKTKCLYHFEEAVSPHIAAQSGQTEPVTDSKLREDILTYIQSCARAGSGFLLMETAGGVNSPAPSGTLQGDLYQSLRLPVCLVADYSLGGISATISAFESLHIRGYTVDAILQFENPVFQNHCFLQDYFRARGIQSLILPSPPLRLPDTQEEFQSTLDYYSRMSNLDCVKEILSLLSEKQKLRIEKLERMPTEAQSKIWYPFTQHKHVSSETIMPIDSASGDFFQTVPLKGNSEPLSDGLEALLSPTFDGSASWWTQGIGHASPTLALAAAHAAGRYGHVMFAGNIHQPALDLAETLLKNLKNPRLSKVFFSDNGSTGVEVAIKMALSATSERYGYSQSLSKELGVIGLKGSYHGDTIGAMDCSEPGIFNKKVPWYQGRGYWFDFPHVSMQNGLWKIILPEAINHFKNQATNDRTIQLRNYPNHIEDESSKQISFEEFPSLGKIFDIKERKMSGIVDLYGKYIFETLKRLTQTEGCKFGALIIEPVLLGAGGMQFIDPLFEHILVEIVRKSSYLFGQSNTFNIKDSNAWKGLPIIFDEVFSGLYRLGRFSAASFLQVHSDISVHAKLLTGGLLPLCCTLASQSIYESFLSDSKTDALLHGHSYTAHPVGCHVANTSLKMMMDFDANETWQEGKVDWWCQEDWVNSSVERDSNKELTRNNIWELANQRFRISEPDVWSVWSYDFLRNLSFSKETLTVVAIGSVLAITLRDENRGYNSTASINLQKHLLEGTRDFQVHVRVLGNVVYVMASQSSEFKILRKIENLIVSYFDDI